MIIFKPFSRWGRNISW